MEVKEDNVKNARAALRDAEASFASEPAGPRKEEARLRLEDAKTSLQFAETIRSQSSEKIDAVLKVRRVVPPELTSFVHDRLKVHLRDQGIRHDVIDAVSRCPATTT